MNIDEFADSRENKHDEKRNTRLPGLLRSYAVLYRKPYGEKWAQDSDQAPVMEESAAEIERLRERLRDAEGHLHNTLSELWEEHAMKWGIDQ